MSEQSIEELKQKIKELETLNSFYEQNGVSKLFYGLNRKSGEMADILNKTNLKNLDLSDPKDKTFERLKIIWQDASGIATAIKALEATAGITNDEAKDTQIPVFRVTPESMADSIGELAGKKS
jgi:hypothetical protein